MTGTIPKAITEFRGAYIFLSNPYPCHITLEGLVYPSSEHAFQACKTTSFEHRRRISLLSSWREAKKHGRMLPLRPGWDEWVRYDAMEAVLRVKFALGSDLAMRLIQTGNAILIEGNTWHDNTWGVCRCGNCSNGHNILGWLLMRLRWQLSQGRP